MQVEDSTAVSPELQKNLGVVDLLRDTFAKINNDSEFSKEMANCIPQIIVIGMQSMGKSSVLERLSGIKFPRDSTMCTRAPIQLCLRRDPESRTIVSVRGPGELNMTFTNPDITECIAEAHAFAVEKCNDTIAKDFVVKVDIQSPVSANFNLLDLPGCFAPRNDDETEASRMVEELCDTYAKTENTLVLHVMAIDQDYGNVSTKLMVSKICQKRVITVFTMADKLANETRERERTSRLQDFLDNTRDTRRFAIFGQATGDLAEIESLNNLRIFHLEHDVKIGAKDLRKYLESRINDLMLETFPGIESVLREKLREVNTWLGENGKKEPHTVVQLLGRVIHEQIDVRDEELGQELRVLWEKMRSNVYKLQLGSLDGEVEYKYFLIEPETLQANDEVYIHQGDSKYTMANVVEVYEDELEISARYYGARSSQRHGFDYIYARVDANLFSEVVSIMNQRSLSNVEFFGPNHVMEKFMSRFADAYGKELVKIASAAHGIAQDHIRNVFEAVKAKAPSSSLGVIKALYSAVLALLPTFKGEAEKFVEDRMVFWCKSPVFTTNDHCLGKNIHMLKNTADLHPTESDNFAALEIIARMNGMRKVKVKAIIEVAADEFTRIFYTQLKKALRDATGNAQEHAAKVEEPSSIAAKREMLVNRRVILTAALDALSQSSVIL